jgi:cation transport ATPase
VTAPGLSESELLRLAAAAEQGSEHPLGQAIVTRAHQLGLELPKPEDFQAIAGKGVQASVEGQNLLLGTQILMQSFGVHLDGLVERAVSVSQATAVMNGETVSVSDAGAQPITLMGRQGAGLAHPSPLGSDGASFDVVRTAALSFGNTRSSATAARGGTYSRA